MRFYPGLDLLLPGILFLSDQIDTILNQVQDDAIFPLPYSRPG